jgi:3D (Asp-Asp-Asp) domain-containing protein
MLKNRIVCLLSITLLFTFPIESNISPFQTTQVVVKDNKGMVHRDRFGLLINPIQEQFEKDRIELVKKKNKDQKITELDKVKENNIEWQEFIVTFYTGLDEENSIYGAVNCRRLPLEKGMVANNILPYGTKIYLENDYGVRTVSDTGGKNFNSSNRIDMFVERRDGETKEQWRKRAESYGIKHIRGYIIK